jgi:hypothetical protein
MEGSRQVTFRFESETEVQYLDRLPSVGDRVTHERELWVVTSVDADAVGVLVLCKQQSRAAPENGDVAETHGLHGSE